MKFTFDRNSMIKEISIAQEIISTKSAISILSNVLFIAENGSLTVKATDLKVNFETKIPVDIEEPGSTTVFCDKLMGILSSLPEGEIEFEIQQKDNQTLALIRHLTQKIKYQLKCMSQDKFPEFPVAEEVPFFEVPSKEIKNMINQTSFAVSEDENRYFMNGVYFEKKEDQFILVATDGRRLSFASKKFDEPIPDFPAAIVHPKVLNIVSRHLSDEGNVEIAIVDKIIFFKFLNYELSSNLLDGQFPNYTRVIPESQSFKFEVDKNEFIESLKRILVMVDKKSGRVFLSVGPGYLKITSQESDLGEADIEIPCRYDGEEVTLLIPYKYIEDPLKVITSDRICFEFTETTKAITLRPEPAEEYFHIMMPLQSGM